MDLKRFHINSKQFKTKNFKGVLSLLAGNTISKIIATIGGLFLANFYGPDNYGVYNVFLSYIYIFPVLTGLRLDNVMIMQRGSKEIRNLFSGILVISFVLTMLIMTVMLLLKGFGIMSFKLPYPILVLTGIGGVLSVWNLTQNNLFTKYRLFRQISTSLVISSLFAVAFQAVFYFMGWKETGLIYGWLVGLTASFIYNVRVSKGRLRKIDIRLFKQSVRENKRIVQYSYPSDAINVVANNIMPILVLIYFSQTDVGIYSMAFKILSVPLMLLAGSVSRVYFQKAVSVNYSDKKGLYDLTLKVIYPNVLIMFGFVILLNTIGVRLLGVFLDEQWSGLGSYILALSFWIIARSALNPIAPVVVVINKNHYSLIFNIYLLLVNFVALYLGVLKGDFLYCIWVFSFLSGAGYLALLAMILTELKKNAKRQ